MTHSAQETVLLEGKKLGEGIREDLKKRVEAVNAGGRHPLTLACVFAGADPASESYARAQEKAAVSVGIRYERLNFDAGISEQALIKAVKDLNANPAIHGAILQQPFPKQVDSGRVYAALDPAKDAEGTHPVNLGYLVMRKARVVPSTPLACMTILDLIHFEPRGKDVVIVGQGAIVGRPLQLLLGERRATTVVCNTGTPAHRIASYVREADLVIACAGQPGLVRGEWIKEGACVLDVGTTEVDGKIRGDVEFETAKSRAKYITPVPGGVGPLTALMLMKNLISLHAWQNELGSSR